jgi:hypothetical protein
MIKPYETKSRKTWEKLYPATEKMKAVKFECKILVKSKPSLENSFSRKLSRCKNVAERFISFVIDRVSTELCTLKASFITHTRP